MKLIGTKRKVKHGKTRPRTWTPTYKSFTERLTKSLESKPQKSLLLATMYEKQPENNIKVKETMTQLCSLFNNHTGWWKSFPLQNFLLLM